MARCEGRKGAALAVYRKKCDLAKSRLSNLPYKSKEIIAAVFADGKSYRISGCKGLEIAPESARIIGKAEADGYQVVWGNSKNVSVERKEVLSRKLNSCFGVKCTSQDRAEVEYDEDR